MVRLLDLLRGYATIRAVGAEPTRILDLCVERGIEFWGARPDDELSLQINVRFRELKSVLGLADESRCELETVSRRGAPLKLRQAQRRFVMWALPCLITLLLIAASFFVWKIDVEGNESISDTEILNALEESGVYIGSYHPSFTNEDIRREVMLRIPELKWVSVCVFGSRAEIIVRERTEIPEVFKKTEPINIIAEYPGVIERAQVLYGQGVVTKGQTVAKGDTLISGVVPSSYDGSILVHAKGEVYARTWHEISAAMSLKYEAKTRTNEKKERWALKIGNERINFYRSSGISGAMCDNIISEYTLGVTGLFSLPISLIRETTLGYELSAAELDETGVKSALESAAGAELQRRIGDEGEILSQKTSFSRSGDMIIATLIAECRQNIAVEKEIPALEIEKVQQGNSALEESITE